VKKPLLETSRNGYLAAVGTSSFSFASMVQRLGPLVRPGGSFLALSYLASQRVVPGYGGGMSSAKAALESDARVLAFEAGRKWGLRVNVISAGPWPSRAASAIGSIQEMIDYCRANSPLPQAITGSRSGRSRGLSGKPARLGHHRQHRIRRQGLSRHGLGLAAVGGGDR